jgi:phage shock protein PspC (stress-responsive transcriptional regulator)
MSRRDRTLYRDTADKKIGGVCSGLAEYFDLDPLLVRVAFVAGIFVSGVSLIVYPLLWWLVDPAPETPVDMSVDTAADSFAPPADGQQAA